MRDDQLRAFVGDARGRSAADQRRRRRWLARQLDEDRAFDDVCRRLVAEAAAVDVVVEGGRVHRGVATDGGGALLVVTTAATVAYVALAAVVGVRARPAGPVVEAPLRVVAATTVGDAVSLLAERQALVTVGTGSSGVHRGRLAGTGRDLLWFVDGLHLRMAAVTEVVVAA